MIVLVRSDQDFQRLVDQKRRSTRSQTIVKARQFPLIMYASDNMLLYKWSSRKRLVLCPPGRGSAISTQSRRRDSQPHTRLQWTIMRGASMSPIRLRNRHYLSSGVARMGITPEEGGSCVHDIGSRCVLLSRKVGNTETCMRIVTQRDWDQLTGSLARTCRRHRHNDLHRSSSDIRSRL